MMRSTVILVLLGVLPFPLAAQRFTPGHVTVRAGFSHSHQRGRFGGGYYPVFFDPLDSDYGSAPEYAPAQPPVVVVQPAARAAATEPVPPPAEPLLIELQGDHYVQVSGDTGSGGETTDARSPSAPLESEPTPRLAAPRPAAFLVFRDGHREEVSSYTISSGVLYASADYYSSGAWNRKIELSSLNLPETIRANQDRGVQFQLPLAPNEVIVGP